MTGQVHQDSLQPMGLWKKKLILRESLVLKPGQVVPTIETNIPFEGQIRDL